MAACGKCEAVTAIIIGLH